MNVNPLPSVSYSTADAPEAAEKKRIHPQMTRLYHAAQTLKGIATPSRLARALQQSPQTLKNWESRGISKSGLLLAPKVVGCRYEWLAEGVGYMRDSFSLAETAPGAMRIAAVTDEDERAELVRIRKVRIHLSAGISGFDVSQEEDAEHSYIFFREDWMRKHGYRHDRLIAIGVYGDSMETGLYDGDTVIVNTADAEPKDGEVFAINYEGEAVVKRLVRDEGAWWLSSDNPDKRKYPRKKCTDEVFMIGRVIHKMSDRI
ncbi:MAG: hypothetical protein LBK01_00395 [Burkholderiaceae bacterium]|jgi:phage repressor protein C with HTH and peptisase S24 domain|nr:hypothetical protein [Burkholderiaceae bacterium]